MDRKRSKSNQATRSGLGGAEEEIAPILKQQQLTLRTPKVELDALYDISPNYQQQISRTSSKPNKPVLLPNKPPVELGSPPPRPPTSNSA